MNVMLRDNLNNVYFHFHKTYGCQTWVLTYRRRFSPQTLNWSQTSCCIFCWWQQKISYSLGNLFKCTWKILLSSFSKWYMVYRLWGYHPLDIIGRVIKKLFESAKTNPLFSRVDILLAIARTQSFIGFYKRAK